MHIYVCSQTFFPWAPKMPPRAGRAEGSIRTLEQ